VLTTLWLQANPQDPSSGTCSCAPGYGDYGCYRSVPNVNNSQTYPISGLKPGDFAWYQVQVRVTDVVCVNCSTSWLHLLLSCCCLMPFS
jgi:hypothetical protein